MNGNCLAAKRHLFNVAILSDRYGPNRINENLKLLHFHGFKIELDRRFGQIIHGRKRKTPRLRLRNRGVSWLEGIEETPEQKFAGLTKSESARPQRSSRGKIR